MTRNSLLVLFLAVLAPVAGHGQATTTPFDPSTLSSRVEIGPVAGLSTTWHRAPHASAVPLGTTLRLRVRVSPGADAIWTGARELDTLQGRSVAELRFDRLGPQEVDIRIVGAEESSETFRFEAIDLGGQPPRFGRPRLTVEPIEIDTVNPNPSSMAYFFQGSSIAELTEAEPGRYRTSVNRWITLATEVEPAALAPLVEWRLDGKPLAGLGSRLRAQLFTTGRHHVSAGTGEPAELETYRVRLTSPRRGEPIATGRPVTFSAETDPPGFENEITWLASTKYGHCDPLLGRGSEFTTTFTGTVGESGSWLGVRADDAVLGLDGKGESETFGTRLLELLETGARSFEFEWPAQSASARALGIGHYHVAADFETTGSIRIEALGPEGLKHFDAKFFLPCVLRPPVPGRYCSSTGPFIPDPEDLLTLTSGQHNRTLLLAVDQNSLGIVLEGRGGATTTPTDRVSLDRSGNLLSQSRQLTTSSEDASLLGLFQAAMSDLVPEAMSCPSAPPSLLTGPGSALACLGCGIGVVFTGATGIGCGLFLNPLSCWAAGLSAPATIAACVKCF